MNAHQPKPQLRDLAYDDRPAAPRAARPTGALAPQPARAAALTAARHAATPPGTAMQDPGWSRTFPATPDRVREARSFLAAILHAWASADDAVLCLSELASNAVTHSSSRNAGGHFTVCVSIRHGYARIEVHDGGGPWTSQADSDLAGGRGLLIVSQLARRWGRSGNSHAGWTVWFDIDVPETAGRNLEEGP